MSKETGIWRWTARTPGERRAAQTHPRQRRHQISAPIRMTFLLDEALNHDLSSVYVTQGDTLQMATVDRCASEENKPSLEYTPTGEMTCLAGSCWTASVARASIAAIAQRTAAYAPSQAAAIESVSPHPMRSCIRSLCLHLRWAPPMRVRSASSSTPATPFAGPVPEHRSNPDITVEELLLYDTRRGMDAAISSG